MPAASRTLRILSKAKGYYFFHVIPSKILIALYLMLVKFDYKKIDITLKLFVQLVYSYIFLFFFLLLRRSLLFHALNRTQLRRITRTAKKNVNKKGVKM